MACEECIDNLMKDCELPPEELASALRRWRDIPCMCEPKPKASTTLTVIDQSRHTCLLSAR